MFALSSEALEDLPLQLVGKGLLYKCHLDISKTDQGLSAEGSLRIGVFSDRVKISTEFEKQYQFSSYFLNSEKSTFWEKYRIEKEQVCFTKSKAPASESVLPFEEGSWWDPLSLLVQLQYDWKKQSLAKSYRTFSGNKFVELVTRHQGNKVQFLKREKVFIALAPTKEGLAIEIPKFRVSLNLNSRI